MYYDIWADAINRSSFSETVPAHDEKTRTLIRAFSCFGNSR